jgi:hypothetical protein
VPIRPYVAQSYKHLILLQPRLYLFGGVCAAIYIVEFTWYLKCGIVCNLQPSIKFTTEKESHKEINFLDLTLHRKDEKLDFSIYRKPTQTDIIIPHSSCHPYEHKLSGINYLLNRLHTYLKTKKLRGL